MTHYGQQGSLWYTKLAAHNLWLSTWSEKNGLLFSQVGGPCSPPYYPSINVTRQTIKAGTADGYMVWRYSHSRLMLIKLIKPSDVQTEQGQGLRGLQDLGYPTALESRNCVTYTARSGMGPKSRTNMPMGRSSHIDHVQVLSGHSSKMRAKMETYTLDKIMKEVIPVFSCLSRVHFNNTLKFPDAVWDWTSNVMGVNSWVHVK